MNQTDMLRIVERFSRNPDGMEEQLKVVRVPDSKTVYIETIGEMGRSIFFNEYTVDGKTYWAGYSSRSNTVFVSQTSRG